MARSLLHAGWTPWFGWIAAPAAWVIHHQLSADGVYFDCHLGPASVALGVACILIAIGGGLVSGASHEGAPDEPRPRHRRFIAAMGLGMGAIFSVALAFQTLAGLIIPSCAR
jgi:hypothetical protein